MTGEQESDDAFWNIMGIDATRLQPQPETKQGSGDQNSETKGWVSEDTKPAEPACPPWRAPEGRTGTRKEDWHKGL